MKTLLILTALAASITSASAQGTSPSRAKSPSAASRASTSNSDTPAPSAVTVTPNYSPGNGQRVGNKKINTAPATGATRASRSSSTLKAAKQGSATGSGNIETMSKNSNAKPGPKK